MLKFTWEEIVLLKQFFCNSCWWLGFHVLSTRLLTPLDFPHEFCLKPRHENYKNVFWMCSRFSSPYLLSTLSTPLVQHWVATLLLSISTKFPFLLDSIWQWEAQLRDQRKKYTLDIYSLSYLPVDPGIDTSWFFLMRATCPAVVTLPHQPFSMGLVTVQLLGALCLITQCGFPWPSPHVVNSPFIKLSSIIPSKSAIWILSGLWTGHN